MTPYDFNRILGYRFNKLAEKYWCFSYDEENGFVFMFISGEYVGAKKVHNRMKTIAWYLLGQFAQVRAVIFKDTTYTRIEDTITIKNQTVMCTKKETGNWLPVVKKTVDSIYEYLIPHQDGISMSGKDYGKRGSRVCSELVSRGIVEKQSLGRGRGWKYRWVATMGPTKVLYGSIAQKLYDEDKMYKDRFNQKRKASNAQVAAVEQPAPVEQAAEPVIEFPAVNDVVTPAAKVTSTKPAPNVDDVKKAWVELINRVEDRPRLNSALQNARLFVMDKTDNTLVFFSVISVALQDWIMKNLILELQRMLREIVGYDKLLLCPTVEIEPVNAKEAKSAEDFSAKENWEALKKKGAVIENNQIVMTEVKVIKTVLS